MIIRKISIIRVVFRIWSKALKQIQCKSGLWAQWVSTTFCLGLRKSMAAMSIPSLIGTISKSQWTVCNIVPCCNPKFAIKLLISVPQWELSDEDAGTIAVNVSEDGCSCGKTIEEDIIGADAVPPFLSLKNQSEEI